MKFKSICLSLVFLFLATTAFAAGTMEITRISQGKQVHVTVAWTSDASGDCDAESFTFRGGTLVAFWADPESGVSDLYDLVLNAAWAIKAESATRTIDFNDVLEGEGANLSNSANGEYIKLVYPALLPSCTLSPIISNAGNAQSGTLDFVFWEE